MHRYQISGVVGCLLFASAPAIGAALPTFEKDIRPILKAHCFECHGEGEKLKGGLDLRLRRLMLQGGDDGPVIVPGRPDRSLLFTMVHSGEMPKRGKKLTHEQVALIKQWIATGAKTARPEPAEIGKGSGITEDDEEFVGKVIRLIEDGSLPKATAKKIAAALKQQIEPLKVLDILRRNVKHEFFQTSPAAHASQALAPREVILSSWIERAG